MNVPKAYFNTASCGLLFEDHLKETIELYHSMCTEGSTSAEMIRDLGVPRIRERVASFLSTEAPHIAFVPNFTYALNSVVQALKGTEKVLLCRHDYPSVLEPFRINKFTISWIDAEDGFTLDVDALKAMLLRKKIKLLVMSHVKRLTGFKMDIVDLGSFCREHGIFFIVDATQSMGAVPIHIRSMHVDVLIASNYKWMNAGFGTGTMYMSDRFLEVYQPVIGGHNSYMMHEGKWQYQPSIRSYEPGHLNFYGLLLLEAAIKHKQEIGIEVIEAHNARLTKLLLDNIGNIPILGPATMEHRSSVVVIKNTGGLQQHLDRHNIVAISRDENIRISIHFHNTEAEVETLIDCLQSFER